MNELYSIRITGEPSLHHYGVLGMRWGVRRYQNSDGTLTKAGKKDILIHHHMNLKLLTVTCIMFLQRIALRIIMCAVWLK